MARAARRRRGGHAAGDPGGFLPVAAAARPGASERTLAGFRTWVVQECPVAPGRTAGPEGTAAPAAAVAALTAVSCARRPAWAARSAPSWTGRPMAAAPGVARPVSSGRRRSWPPSWTARSGPVAAIAGGPDRSWRPRGGRPGLGRPVGGGAQALHRARGSPGRPTRAAPTSGRRGGTGHDRRPLPARARRGRREGRWLDALLTRTPFLAGFLAALALAVLTAGPAAPGVVAGPGSAPEPGPRDADGGCGCACGPGPGHANGPAVWRWGRLAAFRRSRLARPSLPQLAPVPVARSHALLLAWAYGWHALRVPFEEHVLSWRRRAAQDRAAGQGCCSACPARRSPPPPSRTCLG